MSGYCGDCKHGNEIGEGCPHCETEMMMNQLTIELLATAQEALALLKNIQAKTEEPLAMPWPEIQRLETMIEKIQSETILQPLNYDHHGINGHDRIATFNKDIGKKLMDMYGALFANSPEMFNALDTLEDKVLSLDEQDDYDNEILEIIQPVLQKIREAWEK